MKVINTISDTLAVIAKWLAVVSTAVMWLVMCYAVIMRYILRESPVWSDELCRYALVWLSFYGGAVALKRGSLASMDLLINAFKPDARKWVSIIVDLLSLALLIILTKISLDLVLSRSVQIQKSPAMAIPFPIIYSCMPVGLGMMVLQQIATIFNKVVSPLESEAA